MQKITQMNREPQTTIQLKRIHYLILTLMILILAIAAHLIARIFIDSQFILFVYFLPILSIIFAVIAPQMRYRNTAYDIHPAMIEIARGIYQRKRLMVPIDRIQFVEISQGPIARRFNLAKVTIHSNGSFNALPYLTLQQAHETAEHINTRVKEVSAYV